MEKLIINIWKIDKNKESSYLKCWDVNNLYEWAISQKLPVNKFECIEDTSKFNEYVIKNYNEDSDEGYFLKSKFSILKNYMNFIMIYGFYLKEWKLRKLKSLLLCYMIKVNILFNNKFRASTKSWISSQKSS